MLLETLGLSGLLLCVYLLLLRPSTVPNEELVKKLGKASRKSKIQGTAVVCGGSVAGILSARICADHFERVVLVDPEFTKAQNGGEKTRILQYKSVHGFLCLFSDGLRRLWPNVDKRVEQLVGSGTLTPADVKPHYRGVLMKSPYKLYEPDSLPTTFGIRRSQMETVLQSLLLDSPNVNVVDGTVRQLDVDDDGSKIRAVSVRDLSGKNITLDAPSLVLDCTGPSRIGVKLVKSMGHTIPEHSYDNKMVYVTVLFSPPPPSIVEKFPIPEYIRRYPTSSVYTHTPTAPDRILYGLARVENGMYNLVCLSYGDDVPLPRTREELIAPNCLPGMPDWLFTTLKMLVEYGSPTFYPIRLPPCSWVQYDKLSNLPINFIAIGDSVMKVNPVYGQGMSKALISAAQLNASLLECNDEGDWEKQSLSKKFFQETSWRMKSIWDAGKLNDYGYSAVVSDPQETRNKGRLGRWYGDKVAAASVENEDVASALWHVSNLLRPAMDLMMPRVIWGVLKYHLS